MPTGDAYSAGHLVTSLWTCICFTCWDQSFFRTFRYFSGLCSSNTPRYFLDFALNCKNNREFSVKSYITKLNIIPNCPHSEIYIYTYNIPCSDHPRVLVYTGMFHWPVWHSCHKEDLINENLIMWAYLHGTRNTTFFYRHNAVHEGFLIFFFKFVAYKKDTSSRIWIHLSPISWRFIEDVYYDVNSSRNQITVTWILTLYITICTVLYQILWNSFHRNSWLFLNNERMKSLYIVLLTKIKMKLAFCSSCC